MFSHICVGSNQLDHSIAFYNALLEPLGLRQRHVLPDGGPRSACWIAPEIMLPRFYVYEPFDGRLASPGNGLMVAFLARSPDEVLRAYQAAMLVGGKDEGPPGERVHYGNGYFGAYLRDPDGNKIHVCHRNDLAMVLGGDAHTLR